MRVQDHISIHPEDHSNIMYWTKKWGVSTRQLNDAILDTGSINIHEIKNHLRKNTFYYSPILGLWDALKGKIKFIH